MTAVAPIMRPGTTLRDLPRLDAAVRAVVLRGLAHMRHGELEILEDGGGRHRFGSLAAFPVRAVLPIWAARAAPRDGPRLEPERVAEPVATGGSVSARAPR